MYTRPEVIALSERVPERGPLCACCNTKIPQFTDLMEADERRIQQLTRQGRGVTAMAELRAVTGCSLLWAKIWVNHEGQPKLPGYWEAPCPYCGNGLRTANAKQCRHCHKDWHSEPARGDRGLFEQAMAEVSDASPDKQDHL